MTTTEKSAPTVAVIGAGFAGLNAARELQNSGMIVEVFEARDRIGGRAWTDDRLGRPLEMGATWVHWFQPFVWTEVTRYSQGINPSPVDNTAYWETQGEVYNAPEEQADAKMTDAIDEIYRYAREFFPNPHDSLAIVDPASDIDEKLQEKFREFDKKSVMEILDDGDFSQQEKDLAEAFWSAAYIGDPYTGSSLMAKQWAALANHNHALVDEICLRYRLDNGMKGLYEGIRGDIHCPVHLNTPVTRIEYSENEVQITVEDGTTTTFDAVICTAPIGSLSNIEFSPPLPEEKQKVVEEKWNSTGLKIWIKVKGRHKVIGYANKNAPVSMLRSEFFLDDDTTIIVGFGSDHTAGDLDDVEFGQRIIDHWNMGLEVVACTGHDWVDDKWTGQVWGTLRKGQFIDGWSHFVGSKERLHFAGSDWSQGWRGVCVDGALQSGMSVAREVIDQLAPR